MAREHHDHQKKDPRKKKNQMPATGPGNARKQKTLEVAEQILEQVPTEKSAVRFPIIGSSSSPGGLAAFEVFFSGVPVQLRVYVAKLLGTSLRPTPLPTMQV